MKTLRLFLAAALTVAFTMSTSAKNRIGTLNVELENAGNATESVYNLSNETLSEPFNVSVKHFANGSNYHVTCAGFELLYRVRGDKFGVTYVDEKDAKIGKDEMYKQLNREEFLHQYVISDKPKSEEEYMALIAAYLPALIK